MIVIPVNDLQADTLKVEMITTKTLRLSLVGITNWYFVSRFYIKYIFKDSSLPKYYRHVEYVLGKGIVCIHTRFYLHCHNTELASWGFKASQQLNINILFIL